MSSYIQKELERVIKYSESLGVKVNFGKYTPHSGGAEWSFSDQTITIFVYKNMSTTSIILALLHELGHHLDWIYNDKKFSEKANTAYAALNSGPMEGERYDIPQHLRDIILEEEKAAVYYMEVIYKELGLKLPAWKVKLAQAIDIFEYSSLAKIGRFATKEELNKFKALQTKKLKNKYKRGKK